LGKKRDKYRKLKAKVDDMEELRKNYKSEIETRDDKIIRIEESKSEYWETIQMFNEDFERYYKMKNRFEKLHEQFATLKAKYNQLELNILLGNTGLGSGSHNVNLDDPIFAMFT
jgi:DNA repair exonuclease SbcCD ATPase subunit